MDKVGKDFVLGIVLDILMVKLEVFRGRTASYNNRKVQIVQQGSERDSQLLTGSHPQRSFGMQCAMSGHILEVAAAAVSTKSIKRICCVVQLYLVCQYDSRSTVVQQYRISLAS